MLTLDVWNKFATKGTILHFDYYQIQVSNSLFTQDNKQFVTFHNYFNIGFFEVYQVSRSYDSLHSSNFLDNNPRDQASIL